MNKRKRILIASLALIAVTAASTLAYFSSQATIADAGNTTPLQLDITNGQVSITAQPGSGVAIANWSYDVARNSTTNYSFLTNGTAAEGTVAGIADTGVPATDVLNYERAHRSIDMIGLGTTATDPANGGTNVAYSDLVGSYYRWKIGAPVISTIKYARPGDAFVMGKTAAYGGDITNTGLTIKNTSNLTVKVKIAANSDAGQTDTFAALAKAGWKFYVGKKGGTLAEATDLTSLNSALNTALSGQTWGPNATLVLDIRLELPLTTDNTKQTEKTTSGTVSNIDLSKLFTITATQENNPGWNESGN